MNRFDKLTAAQAALKPILEALNLVLASAKLLTMIEEEPSLEKAEAIVAKVNLFMMNAAEEATTFGDEVLAKTKDVKKAKVAMFVSIFRNAAGYINTAMDEIDLET